MQNDSTTCCKHHNRMQTWQHANATSARSPEQRQEEGRDELSSQLHCQRPGVIKMLLQLAWSQETSRNAKGKLMQMFKTAGCLILSY